MPPLAVRVLNAEKKAEVKSIPPSSRRLLRREEPVRVPNITRITLLLAAAASGEDHAMRDKLTGKWLAD